MGDDKRRLPVIDGPVRNDLDDGLRFVHVMGMQVKHDLFEASSKLYALLEELVASGAIDAASLEKRRERIKEREQERQKAQAHVQVSELKDKYALKDLPDIDCASIIPICKARCCKLWFSLSFQDLDEGVVEWDYALPYVIRKRADHRCVHQDAETGGCGIYAHRPGACRIYDCRNDKRIWIDFDKRIPAPDDAVMP
ncbi:MAG TPA: YkgJ family cysteine cluster protein [Haliangiales bacterium]|nr:YkgJ family cysteine cluster protein [Haliangiales bacterium]